MGSKPSYPTQSTAKSKDQRLLTLLQAISLDVAQAETISGAYADVLTHICHFMDWPLAHVYVWSEAANALVSSRIWYMADASTIVPFPLQPLHHLGKGPSQHLSRSTVSATLRDS